jgi:hypothetical protein
MNDRKQKQREAIRAEAARRGITITQRGQGYELKGVGVSLRVLDLAQLDAHDLVPYVSRAAREARA